MKTIKQWLETLPEPFRSEALQNTEEEILIDNDNFEPDLRSALCGAFLWEDAPQGFDYWRDLMKEVDV